MTYEQTIDYLYNSLPVFHHIGAGAYKAGLENTLNLDEHLGHPHRKFLTVHVAGTNGKGSVSHMLASVLRKAGYKVGLYTSPHLVDFRERIRIDGEMVPGSEVVDFVERNKDFIEKLQPSFFELCVGMAFDIFAREGVEVAVVEVGMGGRLDSTNIIRPLLSIITNISPDHMQFLGDTLSTIAGEKAGIIKEGVPVVVGESDPETAPVFITRAHETGSHIVFADRMYRTEGVETFPGGGHYTLRSLLDEGEVLLDLDLTGDYQRRNIVTVLASLDMLNGTRELSISPDNVREGLASAAASTGLQGRWQVLGHDPLMVADTGHNEAGIGFVARQIAKTKFNKLYFIIGMVSDKDVSHILPLLPREAHYIFTQASIRRALDPYTLRSMAAEAGLKGETAPTVAEAVARARELAASDDMIFIGGSTFVVAEALECLPTHG